MAIPMFDELLQRLGNIPLHRICMAVPPGKATEKDVIRLQDRTNRNFELVEGTLVEKPVGQLESSLTIDLVGYLWAYLREHPRGYLTGPDGGMRIMVKLVRMPDISFIAWDQLPTRERCTEPIAPLSPALAVEVLSESNTREEMQLKRKEYFLGGTRLVWIVDPAKRTVEVWTSPDQCVTLTEDQTLDGGDVLPGFRVSLRELFANLPRLPARRGKQSGKRKR
jgi:Uma2 family endonuclease